MSTCSSLPPGRPAFGKHLIGSGLLLATLLSCSAWAGSSEYSYDSLGRLISIQYSDGTLITYTYDNSGNRSVVSIYHP